MSTRIRESRGQEMALTAAVAVVIVLLSLVPMLRLIREIVAPGGTLSTVAIKAGLASPATWIATWHTLVVGIGAPRLRCCLERWWPSSSR
jgi:iron(III) transport system permease protein